MENAPHVQIDTVILFTARLDELAKFYADGLGIGPYERRPQHLGCRLGSIYFGFDHVEVPETAANRLGPTLWFAVDHLEETFARLLSLGATVRQSPERKPWGARIASVYDPEGNLVGLTERPTSSRSAERNRGDPSDRPDPS